jgi:hypothetical protein
MRVSGRDTNGLKRHCIAKRRLWDGNRVCLEDKLQDTPRIDSLAYFIYIHNVISISSNKLMVCRKRRKGNARLDLWVISLARAAVTCPMKSTAAAVCLEKDHFLQW